MTTRLAYTDSSAEPVSVDEAKLAARFTAGALDTAIQGYITTAREAAEHITGRCYREQVLRTELRCWPQSCEAIAVHQATACAVTYWNGSAWVPLAEAGYVFAPGGIGDCGTALAPATGTSWPVLGERPVGPRVRIDLTAGPADSTTVPEAVKLYIQAVVAAWVQEPAASQDARRVANPLFDRLLDGERLFG